MSDPGSFPMGQTPQQSGQPQAGWYFAQGDPPGTERYWSGSAWEGAYRAVGGFTPAEVHKPDQDLPTWLKVIVWTLSVLKAIPLILLGLFVALWSSLTAEIQDDVNFRFREFSILVAVVGFGVILVGVVLLLGQLMATTKGHPGRVAVFAGIMTALDLLFAVGSVGETAALGMIFFVSLALAQATVFVMMLRIWNQRRSTLV